MDKKALRKQIREKKRAMTPQQIEQASARLGELFAASQAYKNAKTVYGYLPYNQEVRTVPMLERALQDGKRVAVPKVYGDDMKFIYMDDLSQVAEGYAGIPEPASATAAASMIASWLPSLTIPPWPFAMIFKCCPNWRPRNLTSPWTPFCGRKELLCIYPRVPPPSWSWSPFSRR